MTEKKLLIAFDIDGTLTGSDHLVKPEIVEALKSLHDKGHIVILATGRHIFNSADIFKLFPFLEYSIHLNGALIYRHSDKKVMYEDYISHDKFLSMAKFLQDNKYFFSVFNLDGEFSTDYSGLWLDGMNDDPNFRVEKVDSVYSIKHVMKILTRPSSSEDREKIREMCNSFNLRYFGSGYNYFEMMNNHASKGHAFEFLCKTLGHAMEQTMAFGDNENDKEMLKIANVGVAMGSAPDNVKDIADFVTDTSDDLGVVMALKKFMLI